MPPGSLIPSTRPDRPARCHRCGRRVCLCREAAHARPHLAGRAAWAAAAEEPDLGDADVRKIRQARPRPGMVHPASADQLPQGPWLDGGTYPRELCIKPAFPTCSSPTRSGAHAGSTASNRRNTASPRPRNRSGPCGTPRVSASGYLPPPTMKSTANSLRRPTGKITGKSRGVEIPDIDALLDELDREELERSQLD